MTGAGVRRFELRIGDVLPGLAGAEQAVTLVVPDPATAGGAPVLLCAYPGGGYGRRYFDIEWQGRADYSQAEYHASRGWIVACVDHLGVGDSTAVDPAVGMRQLAAADAAVAARLAAGLRAGTLVDGLGPQDVGAVLGAGQSMGGYLVTVAQADHRPFDGVAILGSSAIHTVLPGSPGAGASDLAGVLRYAFHGEGDDPAMVDADMDGFPARRQRPPWASATAPPDAVTLLEPGIASAAAAAIDVPVLVATGERDVVPDPRQEPSAYRAAPDIALLVVERMAHMHNFAATRARLWGGIHTWGSSWAPPPGGGEE